MHEFGVTQTALETALAKAEESGAARITDVYLNIGVVTSIEPTSIQMYWDDLVGNTIAEDAQLHFQAVPSESYCVDCGHAFVVETELYPCPRCGSEHVRAVDDEFLSLDAIDIEPLTQEIER